MVYNFKQNSEKFTATIHTISSRYRLKPPMSLDGNKIENLFVFTTFLSEKSYEAISLLALQKLDF